MPELPEVETVRRYLESNIIGEKIIDFNLYSKKSLRNVNELELKKIINQKIISIDRKAKHLIIRFEKNYIICHLRMEGKFFIFNSEKEMNKIVNRNHNILLLKSKDMIILFQDTRKFATIDFFENNVEYEKNYILSKIANEPFKITDKDLFEKLNKKRTSIKTSLLDQKVISGLGNIYVDEVLFSTNIHPLTKSNKLKINDCKNIINESKRILSKSIELKGTTIKSYTSSLGVEGKYQNFLMVHQRVNEKCKKCKNNISKIKVSGRGTYFCSICQKIIT